MSSPEHIEEELAIVPFVTDGDSVPVQNLQDSAENWGDFHEENGRLRDFDHFDLNDDRAIESAIYLIRATISKFDRLSPQDAEDITQEVLAKAIKYMNNGGTVNFPITWFKITARHRVLQHFRDTSSYSDHEFPSGLQADPVFDNTGNVDDRDISEMVAARLDAQEYINSAMHSLSEDEKKLVKLHDLLGGDWKLIMKYVGALGLAGALTYGALKVRQTRAVKKMRTHIDRG